MRLSFVIPTRNQGRFVRRCIESCVEQGIDDSEIVVVDGLSTDGTQDVLRSYGSRVRWTSERDSGQAEAVNKGIAEARGEVVAWINSDDAYAGPGVVAPIARRFEAEPDLDVAYGEAMMVDERGAPIRPYVTRDVRTSRRLLLAPQGPSQPATFFRRQLFLEAGGLRTDLHLALDYELWLRLFAAARRIERVPELIALMTWHASAKSIASMGEQISEAARIKRDYATRLRIPAGDRLVMELGIALNRLYVLAVRAGLRRAA